MQVSSYCHIDTASLTITLLQVRIYDVRLTGVLVSEWWLLGTQVVTSLLYQVTLLFSWILISNLYIRSCTYPGAVIHGTINPVMFYYKVSQTVTYKCSKVIQLCLLRRCHIIIQQEFRLEGKPVLTCGKNGAWDAPIPTCVAKKITS